MADKALLSKNPNDEVLAKDLSERDQSRIFYCAGVNDKGEHCFAPMHLILRSGNALRKGSQYFEEKSSNGSHIPNCSCANKSKDKVRINRFLKFNGRGFDFIKFCKSNTKEIYDDGNNSQEHDLGGNGRKGKRSEEEIFNYKDEDRYTLPRTINDLAAVFDRKGVNNSYGPYIINSLYLCNSDFRKYYENGLYGNVLVKAEKTKRCTFLSNDVFDGLKREQYRYLALNGEEGRIELLLRPKTSEIARKIWKTIESFADNPEKKFVVLGSWRIFDRAIKHLYVCDIINEKQFRPEND